MSKTIRPFPAFVTCALSVLLVAGPARGGETLSLTLQGAILYALEHSPQLRVERFGALAEGTRPEEARAAFDPNLSASLSHGESHQPASARQSALEVAGARERRGRDDEAAAEVSQRLPTGTRVALSGETTRSRSNFFEPEYGSRLELEATQPLLQGLRPSVNLAGVRLAENAALIGRYAFLGALEDLISGVEQSYWDLLFARRAAVVREGALEAAERLLADAEARFREGRLPRVDLAAPKAEVAARRQLLADAEAAAEAARLELVRALGPSPGGEGEVSWRARMDLVDKPLPPAEPPDLTGGVSSALARRPDLLEARLQLDNRQLEVVQTKDGLLPRLDLVASYGLVGREPTLGRSWSSISRKGFEDWRVGLSFETPLPRRGEEARTRRAEFSRLQAEAAVDNLQVLIEAQVRRGVQEVERLMKRLPLAEATRGARAEEADAERARFEAGRTTSSDVLQAENRLAEAMLDLERTQTDLRKSWAELKRLEGRLAEARGIETP